jgi:hypothetical protein
MPAMRRERCLCLVRDGRTMRTLWVAPMMRPRITAASAGLALATVAFVAAIGGETGVGENCHPTPRMSLEQSSSIKRSMIPFGHSAAEFELDHIIPLCIGGSNARLNLQLQPWPTARLKDIDEARVCRMVHSGEMSCAEGRELMQTWGRR